MKIAKIIIRYPITNTSHHISNPCLLLDNRHKNEGTRANKRNLSIRNRAIYGKKCIHSNAKE